MQNAHLKSGKISDYVPIGQDGQPVYRNAEAFMAALAINPNVGPNFTRHLARPKIAADGNTIDWYIPFNPTNPDGQYRIVTWQAATPEEQAQARAQLSNFELVLKRVGADLARHSSVGSSKLFASYLTGQSSVQQLPAIHFPNNDCLFIVDGVAVITFWGFTENGAPMEQSPFASLNAAPKGAAPLGTAPLGAGQANAAAAAPSQRKGCLFAIPPLLLWLLLGLLLLLLLWWLLPWLWGLIMSLFNPNVNVGVQGNVNDPANLDPGTAVVNEATTVVPGDTLNVVGPDGSTILLDPADPNVTLQAPDLPPAGTDVVTITQVPIGAEPVDGALATPDPLSEVTVPADDAALAEGQIPADGVALAEGPMPPEGVIAPDGALPAAGQVAAEGQLPAEGQEPASGLTPPDPLANMGKEAPNQGMVPPDPLANPGLTPEQEEAIAAARAAEAAALGNGESAQNTQVPPEVTLNEQSLAFSEQALAKQGASVLNGAWNTRSGLMDSATGTPLQMGYSFDGNKGQVTVTRPDGVKCVAATNATVDGSAVNITTQGRALCPDGRSYQMPAVKCQPQGNGSVRCTGSYGSHSFPIQFYAQ